MSSRIPVPCFGRFIFSTHTIFDCIILGYCKICSLFLRMFSSLTLIIGCRIDLVLKSVLIPVCGHLEAGRATSTKLSSLYFLCISSSLCSSNYNHVFFWRTAPTLLYFLDFLLSLSTVNGGYYSLPTLMWEHIVVFFALGSSIKLKVSRIC